MWVSEAPEKHKPLAFNINSFSMELSGLQAEIRMIRRLTTTSDPTCDKQTLILYKCAPAVPTDSLPKKIETLLISVRSFVLSRIREAFVIIDYPSGPSKTSKAYSDSDDLDISDDSTHRGS